MFKKEKDRIEFLESIIENKNIEIGFLKGDKEILKNALIQKEKDYNILKDRNKEMIEDNIRLNKELEFLRKYYRRSEFQKWINS